MRTKDGVGFDEEGRPGGRTEDDGGSALAGEGREQRLSQRHHHLFDLQ